MPTLPYYKHFLTLRLRLKLYTLSIQPATTATGDGRFLDSDQLYQNQLIETIHQALNPIKLPMKGTA